MNIVLAAIVIAVVSAVAIAAMLLVRRRAPEGSYFSDGDRASGVFGVLATGFSVLLGFLIFLAFESYDASRTGAETEAVTVAQQMETAQLLPAEATDELTGELICYARWVVHGEWERMERNTLGDADQPVGRGAFETVDEIEPASTARRRAFGKWLDQTADRESARQDRIHGATGIIPVPLWVALFFIAGNHFRVHAVLRRQRRTGGDTGRADGQRGRGHHRHAAAAQLPRPSVHEGIGGLQPVAMERTLRIVDQQLAIDRAWMSPFPATRTGIAV